MKAGPCRSVELSRDFGLPTPSALKNAVRRPIVSPSVLASLIVSAVLSVVWPIAIFLICRGRMTLAVRNMLVGAAVFLVFSQVLEKALHVYLLKTNPTTAAWLKTHGVAFALYGCLAAGLFEE